MRRLFISMLICLGCSGWGMAQESSAAPSRLRSLLSGEDARDWSGVGQLHIAGQIMCSGALIADDIVITAAHCVHDPDSHRRFDPAQIEFLADLRAGRPSAVRKGRYLSVIPQYNPGSGKRAQVESDVALLMLDRPIRSFSVTPFALGISPAPGENVGVVSYAHDRTESPALEETCAVEAREGLALILTCSVAAGSSGAPVLRIENGVATVVSVVSATGQIDNRQVAISTVLDGRVDLLLAEINAHPRAQGIGVNRLTPDSSRNGSGAKFLRP